LKKINKEEIIMSKLTRRIINEKYMYKKQTNSFYQEQNLGTNTTNVYKNYNFDKDILYYVDKNTGKLKMKSTYLLNK